MRVFVQIALVAAWICVVTASPVPNSRYSESEGDQTVYKAEDHLFNDAGFPLRVRAHTQAFSGFAGSDGEDSDRPSFHVSGGETPFNHPMSGFFFDMHDMMKILRDQMTEVLARVPESSVGNEGLSPSDVKNQTTSKVEYLDGHKVVINDTTYSNGDTNHGSIFHVQIVDLLPLDPEDPSHPAEDPAEDAAPATPKTKISNEIPRKPEERDREEVEDDEDEIGEDIDEVVEKDVKPKPAKKVDRKDAKVVVEKKEEKVVKKEEKVAKKEEKVEKREKAAEKEVEVFDDEPDRAEDEEEGEDIPDMDEKKGDMNTAESRWTNEIDNRIDTYQPYYKPNKQSYNRFSDFYYEPYYKPKPNYNSYQPYYNVEQPKYDNRQPMYSPDQYNYESTYKPEQPSYNFESAYKPEQPNYNYKPYQQPSYDSHQPIYNAQPEYNSYDSAYKPNGQKDNDRFMDLSSDTKVNDFMADQQQAGLIMIDPDAELIDINKKPIQKYPRYNYRKY